MPSLCQGASALHGSTGILDQSQQGSVANLHDVACKSLIAHDAGVDEPDSGAVRKRNTSIGYLPQSPELDEGLSAIDAILNSGSILARCSLAYEQAIASGDQKVTHSPSTLLQLSLFLHGVQRPFLYMKIYWLSRFPGTISSVC